MTGIDYRAHIERCLTNSGMQPYGAADLLEGLTRQIRDGYPAEADAHQRADDAEAERDQLAAVADADSKQLAEVDARCDRYAAAIARVRELHRTDYGPGGYCFGCRETPCPTITALDGPATAEPSPDGDTCEVVEADGQPIRVHGHHPLTATDEHFLGEIIGAAKRKFAAEPPVVPDDTGTESELTRRIRAQQRGEMVTKPEPHTGLVVKAYSDHGLQRWVFRCWGTDTCDGALSLDHYNEGSAHAAQDRHVAEEHTADTELQQRRAAGDAARLDAIDRTEHANLNRHHLRPTGDTDA